MRKDEGKTKEPLLKELEEMRQRIKELEASEAERKQTEEELRVKDNAIVSSINAIAIADLEGNLTYVNHAFLRMWGYADEKEILGKNAVEFWQVAEQAVEVMQAAMDRGGWVGELVAKRKDGSIFDVQLSASVARDKAGRPICRLGSFVDITEHKQAEEALKDSEERYRSLVNNIKLGILRSTPGTPGRVLEVNPASKEITGYPREELLKIDISKLYVHPEEREAILEEIALARGAVTVELQWRKKDGTEIAVLDRVIAVRDDTGKILYFDAIIEDITERKRVKEVLWESEERLRSVVQTAKDAISITDSQGNVILWNRAAEAMFGYTSDEISGKSVSILMPERFHTIFEDAFKKTVASGEMQSSEAVAERVGLRKDGSEFPIEISDSQWQTKDGVFFTSIMRDITERKRLEEARMEQAAAQARAEEVQQSRQRIIAMQESLRRDIAQQLHGTVQNRLIVLMHRLADIERTSPSEQMTVEVADLRQKLEEVLEGYIRPISHRLFPSILRRGLVPALQSLVDHFETAKSIDMELSEELKRQERTNPRFITEQVRLAAYRIAEEALVNATKHAKASRITVKLELSSEGWLGLTVRDDGQGFDMESASAGLGKLMMQDYAEVVGGSCVISSAPGKGTEVTALVPLAESGVEYPARA